MKLYITLLSFTCLLFIDGCSGSINVVSSTNEGNTVIDGNTSEWKNLSPLKNENIAFGFSNDNQYLYIAMVTNDRSKIMKIITGGLEIWLEPDDADAKIGIRYPERPDPAEMMKLREQNRNMQNGGENTSPPQLLSLQSTLTILSEEGNELKQFPVDGNTYKADIKIEKGSFCYELRIPIGESIASPEGLKTKSGDKIGIEFITGDPFREMMRRRNENMGSNMPPPSDGHEGRGPGGPGGPGGMRTSNSGPLNYTFDVTLK